MSHKRVKSESQLDYTQDMDFSLGSPSTDGILGDCGSLSGLEAPSCMGQDEVGVLFNSSEVTTEMRKGMQNDEFLDGK